MSGGSGGYGAGEGERHKARHCDGGLLVPAACALAMRRQRVNGASPVEPANGDDLPTTVRIDNAVAVAEALPGLAPNSFNETLFRAMLVNVHTNATVMVMIANAGFQ